MEGVIDREAVAIRSMNSAALIRINRGLLDNYHTSNINKSQHISTREEEVIVVKAEGTKMKFTQLLRNIMLNLREVGTRRPNSKLLTITILTKSTLMEHNLIKP